MSESDGITIPGPNYGPVVGTSTGTVSTSYAYHHYYPPPPTVDLAAALARLAQLPHAQVPAIAPLPVGSRMPLPPNPLFVGREDKLQTLAAALGTSPTRTVALTGMGGIGKTQMASAFAHRYGTFFTGGVFWVSCEQPEQIAAEVAACGGIEGLDLPVFAAHSLPDQVARVGAAWRAPLPRLLIFDNCEDEALLTQWRPTTGGCHILLTSRRANWDVALGVVPCPVGTLPRPDSVALLRRFRPDLASDDPDLAQIAATLGDLPLALHLAGNYLKVYHAEIMPCDYLAELVAGELLAHDSLQGEAQTYRQTDQARNVARSFARSYEQLRSDDILDQVARALLARVACLAPDEPIPRNLLLSSVVQPDRMAELRAGRAVRRLANLGLLDLVGDEAVRLHALLAQFIRMVTEDAGALTDVTQAVLTQAERLLEAGAPVTLRDLQPHLQQLIVTAQDQRDATTAQLCSALGRTLRVVGDYAAARPLLERALAIREQVLGPQHPDTATSLNNLAGLLRAQGDYLAARPLYERALAIRVQVLGQEHPDTATSLNNLALLLDTQGDYLAARPLYERALAIREQVLGPQHPDTAASLNNLAALLQAQGDYPAARPLFERALAIREQVLGPQHPDTATSLNNLAALLQAQGDYPAARPLFERALAIYEQVLGPQHPHTQITRGNLAQLD